MPSERQAPRRGDSTGEPGVDDDADDASASNGPGRTPPTDFRRDRADQGLRGALSHGAGKQCERYNTAGGNRRGQLCKYSPDGNAGAAHWGIELAADTGRLGADRDRHQLHRDQCPRPADPLVFRRPRSYRVRRASSTWWEPRIWRANRQLQSKPNLLDDSELTYGARPRTHEGAGAGVIRGVARPGAQRYPEVLRLTTSARGRRLSLRS